MIIPKVLVIYFITFDIRKFKCDLSVFCASRSIAEKEKVKRNLPPGANLKSIKCYVYTINDYGQNAKNYEMVSEFNPFGLVMDLLSL